MPSELAAHFPAVVFFLVVLAWIAFALIFLTRKAPPKTPDQKRDPGSITGLVIQGISYAIVWGFHRPYFTPLLDSAPIWTLFLGMVAVVMAFGAVMFMMRAIRTLGKEWSLTARVVENHELATSGPYRWVRHPIYTGMLAMLLATGIATSQLLALVAAVIVLMIGTIIRIRAEERLLRETFGNEFDTYANRVAAFVPWIY